MLFNFLNIIILFWYVNNKLMNMNIYLFLKKNKQIFLYRWIFNIIYLYKRYLPYIIRISLSNAFIIFFINYIYNLKKNNIIKDNPFL